MLNSYKVTKGMVDAIDKAQTNADRIRTMTDEELARALKGAEIQALLFGTTSTEGVWLDWLQKPVEGEKR